MTEKSSSNAAIAVAVIGVLGTISAALIANWDKLSGARTAVPSNVVQASPNAATTQPASDGAAADKGVDAAAPINVAGKWVDASGYEYVFEQSGNDYTYSQFKNGVEISQGSGTLSGRKFESFFNGNFGQGSCKGELSADLSESNSICTIGVNQFPLRVFRSAAAKS